MNNSRSLAYAAILLFLGALMVAAVFVDWVWVAAGVATVVLLRLVVEDNRDLVLVAFLAVIWTVAIDTGLVQFSFFDQILSLLERQVDPVELLLRLDVWGPRYLISYPAVWIADHWHMSLDEGFTVYGGLLLASEAFVLTRIAHAALGPDRRFPADKIVAAAVFSAWTISLATFMNGRLAAAHLGIAIIVSAQVTAVDLGKTNFATWFLQAFGLFLTMMTSGTAMVGFTQVACAPVTLGKSVTSSLLGRVRVFVPAVVVLLVASPLIWVGITKNIDFWGGGTESLQNMLAHGWGEWILSAPAAAILALCGGFLYVAGGRWWSRQDPRLLPLIVNVPIAVTLGLYGYSTLTMVLPGVAALSVVLAIVYLPLMLNPARRLHPVRS